MLHFCRPNGRAQGPAGFPDTTYSQSLLCITLDSARFENITTAQMVNYPFIYDSFISPSVAELLPSFAEWLDNGKSAQVLWISLYCGFMCPNVSRCSLCCSCVLHCCLSE
jgi:hypothetical protein